MRVLYRTELIAARCPFPDIAAGEDGHPRDILLVQGCKHCSLDILEQRQPLIGQSAVELDEIGAGFQFLNSLAPISGNSGPTRSRVLASRMVARSNSGAPDRPPASPAWRASDTKDRSSVVLETIMPSRRCAATERTIASS